MQNSLSFGIIPSVHFYPALHYSFVIYRLRCRCNCKIYLLLNCEIHKSILFKHEMLMSPNYPTAPYSWIFNISEHSPVNLQIFNSHNSVFHCILLPLVIFIYEQCLPKKCQILRFYPICPMLSSSNLQAKCKQSLCSL